MIKVDQKYKINLTFIMLTLILAAVFFLFFLNNFKYYQSEIKILFIPQSEKMENQSSYFLENLVRLPRMLYFYEKMIKENADLNDQFSEISKDEKKKKWNEMIETERDDGSSIITLKITSRDKSQSALLAKRATQTLFNTASFYYDIKKDIDLRIADGVITRTILKNWIWLLLESIFLGLFFSYWFNVFLAKIAGFHQFKLEKLKIKKPSFSVEAKKEAGKEKEKKERESASFWQKKASAPQNLPVAETEEDFKDIEEKPEIIEGKEKTIYSEPSEKELKERLNQLLRGEL